MSVKLFEPITLGGQTLPNRIIVAPMCQYAAVDGVIQPWHTQHIGSFAASGFGMIIMEATGIEAIGRISPACPGLWNDTQEAAFKTLIDGIRTYSDVKIGIQLSHAGRKASTGMPWQGGRPVPNDQGGWDVVGPSAIAFADGWKVPAELTADGIGQVINHWKQAAIRAGRAGFDAVEIHAAHGYLLHEFLSPLSNRRTDQYGGDLAGRMRLILEVIEAVRSVWPKEKTLGLRISATDWADGGVTVEDCIALAAEAKARGVDFIHVSTGGNVAGARIPVGPHYQVPMAAAIRKAVPGLPVMAVGLIVDPQAAEAVLQEGEADLVALARTVLDDPRWVWHAADALGVSSFEALPRFARARPAAWPGHAQKAGALRQAAE